MSAEHPLDDPCGCTPTAAEQRRARGSAPRLDARLITRRGAMMLGAVGAFAAGTAGAAFGPAPSGVARALSYNPSDYPSWEDVERARGNESAKGAEISRIRGLIADLNTRVEVTRAAAEAASNEYYRTQQAFLEAAYRADQLQAQADAQAAVADEAAAAAARLTALLARSGGEDTPLEVIFAESGDDADAMLKKLGQMDKLIQRNTSVYDEAAAARETAQSLSDQAKVARDERDRLQKIAQSAMEQAQHAQAAAEAALAEQRKNIVVLQAQLEALEDTTEKTVKEYEDGVKAKQAYEEEQERLAREEAQRKADEERRLREEEEARERQRQQDEERNRPDPGGDPSPDPGPAPAPPPPAPGPPDSGWTRPSSGWISSPYGPRTSPCGGCSSFHLGLDFAAGCHAPIVAAANGVVEMAGWSGGYGNYIRLDHGYGVGTGYAHIVDGGIQVWPGQQVSVGQLIAYEGTTGASTGCHLHFEVYAGGGTVDPAVWLADRGVWV